ncbi:MAG: LPS export ABC transporter periplasmic protein LptC [Candidatus Pelagibacter sp.]|nr:LPS export ABC transporter periplasmic protein LptC [Pelagibacterales bacterium SAG-MED23]
MSFKLLIQVFIIILIATITGVVYVKYFNFKGDVVEEFNLSEKNNNKQIVELEKKISKLELQNNKLNSKIDQQKDKPKETLTKIIDINKVNGVSNDKELNSNSENQDEIKSDEKKINDNKDKDSDSIKLEIKNLVKDVEYTSIDQKGNRFYLLATSGRSNKNNNDILDLKNVRGQIKSDRRDTIYIVSDYAQYNSMNLNSKFYENVIIDYQDRKITCINFDINMETSKAIAYNNVVITDPNSIMRAGIVEFDLKTKDVNINPESATTEIVVITN